MAIIIESVYPDSPADRAKILGGDGLVSIDGHEIHDVLDYSFYASNSKLKILIQRGDKLLKIKIKKDEYEDLGLEFQTYLMDKHRSCCNKCIFCFVDQMPPNMRESLYFKDDDSRLSFLFGNYVTLTNMSEADVDRIIKMKISPINISVHTVDPDLRCKMMNNRFAGKALDILFRLAKHGIKLNCQLVLCPGYNDGDKLKESLHVLGNLYPSVQSIACVPVGVTNFRENLTELHPFDGKGAGETIDIIDSYGDEFEKKFGERIAYASDEFYLLSNRPFPDSSYYGEYMQLDNGVGMSTLFADEFRSAMAFGQHEPVEEFITVATGVAAYGLISSLVDELKQKWHNLKCDVCCIENNYFGKTITVSGLITGRDLIDQLKDRDLGKILLIPRSMIRYQGDCFLDDVTIEEVEEQLNVQIRLCENDGGEFYDNLINGGETHVSTDSSNSGTTQCGEVDFI